jgi:hypothetical protein
MTWTYTPTIIGANPFMQVRLLIGDKDVKNPLLQDEEIIFVLALDPSIWRAAANCCRTIAGGFSRDADSVQGELKQVYSVRAKAYLTLAAQYTNDAVTRGGGIPYAGGISVMDKTQQEQNTDRVAPQFNLGEDANLSLPVGEVGNETSSNAEPVVE